jgi:hypothetical protein
VVYSSCWESDPQSGAKRELFRQADEDPGVQAELAEAEVEVEAEEVEAEEEAAGRPSPPSSSSRVISSEASIRTVYTGNE